MNNENSGNPTLRWIFWILAFIVLIIAINLGIKSYKENHPKKVSEVKNESVEYTYHWIIDNRKTINFTGEYAEVIYTPTDRAFSFENSSEPYCVKNTADVEVCGQKAEDISPKIPPGNANTGLRFKSTNGKSGHIVFVTWVKAEERI